MLVCMRIYRRFCNAWPAILLAVFLVATCINLRNHNVAAAQAIKAPNGFLTAADTTAVNMKLAKYDSALHSPCAHAIGKTMDAEHERSPKNTYTTTRYLLLHLPMEDSIDWASEINYDFEVIDAVMSRCR
jgi:hypothetical protein